MSDADPTAIGPSADETVIVSPPTQAAQQLAWTDIDDDDDDDDAPRWGPVWLRAAIMVSCAVAVAITVAIVGLTIDAANDPTPQLPSDAAPMLAPVPPPVAAPAPEPKTVGPVEPAPTVTVTQTPAAAVVPPAPPRDANRIFLDEMRAAGYPITETAVALAAAPKGCDYLATGHTPREAADLAMHNNPAISPEEASAYVQATIDAYCPQDRGELR